MNASARYGSINPKAVALTSICAIAVAWTAYSLMSHRDSDLGRALGPSGGSPDHLGVPPPPPATSTVTTQAATPAGPETAGTRYNIELEGKTADEARDAIRDMVATAVAAKFALPSNVGSTEALVLTVAGYVGTHAVEKLPEFIESLEKSGISVPDTWKGNAALEEFYSKSSAWLRAVRFDPAGVLVRPVRKNGIPVDHHDETALRVKRDAGRPSLQQLDGSQINEYEVIFPAMIPARDNTTFPGRIGITLSWDPNLKKWLVTQSCVYDQPTSPVGSVPLPIL